MTLLYPVVYSIGLAANTLTYLSLLRTPPSTPGCTLLRHQCFLDAALCVAGLVLLAQPQWWHSGLPALDAILCRLWYSDFLFFGHSNVSLSVHLLCVLDHLSQLPKVEFELRRRSESWYLLAVYASGYVSAAPELATVTFDESKCFSRMSLPPGLDAVLCAVAVMAMLVPLTFVCLFLRQQCLLRLSVSAKLNRKQSRRRTLYVFATHIVALVILTYIISSMRRLTSMYSRTEIMLALILIRSAFTTPGLVVFRIISAETDSSPLLESSNTAGEAQSHGVNASTCAGAMVCDCLASTQ